MIKIGDSFAGRYEVLAKLGEGGMGTVYKVRDTELHSFCALKILSSDLLSSKETRDRFLREGKAMSRITHTNVARIFRLGVEGLPYLILEYLEGESLRALISREGKIPTGAAVSIIMQACAGMSSAHEQNVLHRDIKPDNIMIVSVDDNDEKVVKMVDFGLARFNAADLAKSQHLTQTGALIGSVHYMSPEQCAGQRADERSDVYALGCVLFECVAGQPPYDADSAIGVLHKHRYEQIPSLRDSLPDNEDLAINAILNKALAKIPSKRYQSMLEFRNDLESFARGEPPIAALGTDNNRTKPALKLRALSLGVGFAIAVLTLVAISPLMLRMTHRSESTKVLESEQEINKLVNAGDYQNAIRQISKLLSETSPDWCTPYQGRLRIKEAICLQKLGNRNEANEELKRALMELSRTRFSTPADLQANRQAIIEAVEILTANKVFCHFLHDSYLTSFSLGSRAVLLNGSADKAWVRAVGQLFKNCDDKKVCRALIKLEEPYARRQETFTRAAYNFACAYYESSRAERLRLGNIATELFQYSRRDGWWAAEAFYWSCLRPPLTEYDPKLIDRGSELLPPPSQGTGLPWHSEILANYAGCMVEGGDYVTAVRFCKKWLNHERGRSLYECELLSCYISALEKMGRIEEAKEYLLARIKKSNGSMDSVRDATYLTALAQLYFDGGDAKKALEASYDVISIIREHFSGVNWDSYFEVRSTNIALSSCSFLGNHTLFDAIYITAEDRHGKYKFLTLKLDELTRREQYSNINASCEKLRLRLQTDIRDTSEPRDAVALSAWHCARVGALSASVAMCRKAEELGPPNADLFMAKVVAGETESIRKLLPRLLAKSNMDDDESQELAGILAICQILSKDRPAALRLISHYPQMPLRFKELITKLELSRDGNVDAALRADSKDIAVPTFGSSRVFEKLLMARVATAYGRTKDVPKYLSAARTEMLRVLPANHTAVSELNEQIAKASL